jgi:hypothetical protein
MPSGLISNPPSLDQRQIEDLQRWYLKNMEMVKQAIREFRQAQIILIGFLLSALISLVGNFIVSSLFGSLIVDDINLTLIFAIIFIILIPTYLFYLMPQMELIIYWIPYSSHYIPDSGKLQQLTSDPSDIELIYYLVNIVALALIRDSIKKSKSKNIKIINFARVSPSKYIPVFSLEIRPSGMFLLINPRSYKQIEREYCQIVTSLHNSIMSFSVRNIDYNPNEWSRRSVFTLKNIINLENAGAEQKLITQIKSL